MGYVWLSLVVMVVAVSLGAWLVLKLCGLNPDKHLSEKESDIPTLKDVVHEIPTLTDAVHEKSHMVFCGGLALRCETAKEVAPKDWAYWTYVWCVALGLPVDWGEEKRERIGKGDRTTFSEICLLGVGSLVFFLSDIFNRRGGGAASIQEKTFLYMCPRCQEYLSPSDFLMEVPPPPALSKPGFREFSFRHSCGCVGYLAVANMKDAGLISFAIAEKRASHLISPI